MKYDSTFAEGMYVKYREYYGEIRCILPDYLTLCIAPRNAKMVSEVCILITEDNWDEIHLLKESEK